MFSYNYGFEWCLFYYDVSRAVDLNVSGEFSVQNPCDGVGSGFLNVPQCAHFLDGAGLYVLRQPLCQMLGQNQTRINP